MGEPHPDGNPETDPDPDDCLGTLLSTEAQGGSDPETHRRAEASATLLELAREDPDSLTGSLPALLAALETADETGRETVAGNSPGDGDALVRCLAHVVIEAPGTVAERGGAGPFVRALSPALDDGTLRVATRALFAGLRERPEAFAPAAELLCELVTHSDSVVQTWVAGALGQLAPHRPDSVAAATPDLRALLDHADDAVRHNAIEALAALVRERPEAVAPAADAIGECLDHGDVAIQHNAAGVLGVLAADYPGAVAPYVDELDTLRDHEREEVRRVATGALARLATDRC